MTKGNYPRGEDKRLSGMMLLDGGARCFRVTHDPSGFFRSGIFRLSDVLAGGFDPGTTFVHVHDRRLKYVVNEMGVARKVIAQKRGKAKPKRVILIPNGIYLNRPSTAAREQ